MSDSNRVGLAYVKEVTYGVVPGTQLKNIRFTSESLGQDTDSTTSQEIRSDRQISDLVRTNIKGSGDINGEVSFGAYDDFFEWGLQSLVTWSTPVAALSGVTSLEIAVAGGIATITRVGGSFSTDAITVGSMIQLSGMATPGNNTYAGPIITRTGTQLTMPAGALVTEAASVTGQMKQLATISNSTTLNTMSIEKVYSDIASTFAMYSGFAIDRMRINAAADQIMTCGFSFVGKKEVSASVTGGTGTNAAAPTGSVMNGIDNVESFLEAGASLTGILSLSMELNNNLRHRNQIGTLGSISIGSGSVNVTGTVQAYFNSAALVDKYLNFTATTIQLVTVDAAGDKYIFLLPRVKYSNARRVAGGLNQDVVMDLNYTAYMCPACLKTIVIARIDAP